MGDIKMIDVPVVPTDVLYRVAKSFPEALQVSKIQAHSESGQPVVMLLANSPPSNFGETPRFELALSPPAATKLAALLDEAVKKYLGQLT